MGYCVHKSTVPHICVYVCQDWSRQDNKLQILVHAAFCNYEEQYWMETRLGERITWILFIVPNYKKIVNFTYPKEKIFHLNYEELFHLEIWEIISFRNFSVGKIFWNNSNNQMRYLELISNFEKNTFVSFRFFVFFWRDTCIIITIITLCVCISVFILYYNDYVHVLYETWCIMHRHWSGQEDIKLQAFYILYHFQIICNLRLKDITKTLCDNLCKREEYNIGVGENYSLY